MLGESVLGVGGDGGCAADAVEGGEAAWMLSEESAVEASVAWMLVEESAVESLPSSKDAQDDTTTAEVVLSSPSRPTS